MFLSEVAKFCSTDQHGKPRVSHETQRIYKSTVGRFIEYFGEEVSVESVQTADLIDWQEWLDARPESGVTTDNTYKRTARALWNYMEKRGVEVCQTNDVWNFRKEERKLNAINQDNAYKMLGFSGIRDTCILTLAFESARRRGGLADLQLKNLRVWYDDESGEYRVVGKVREKGDKPQILLGGHEAGLALEIWLRIRGGLLKTMDVDDHGYVFINLRNGEPLTAQRMTGIVYRIKQKAGIPADEPTHLHSFRHRRAKELLKVLSLPEVRDILGHEESSTTADIYAVNSDEDLINAFFTRGQGK